MVGMHVVVWCSVTASSISLWKEHSVCVQWISIKNNSISSKCPGKKWDILCFWRDLGSHFGCCTFACSHAVLSPWKGAFLEGGTTILHSTQKAHWGEQEWGASLMTHPGVCPRKHTSWFRAWKSWTACSCCVATSSLQATWHSIPTYMAVGFLDCSPGVPL